jgi:colanic acid biosynthesis protein WcaH
MIKIAISGSFDPLHSGHLDYIREAKKHGDYLIVILKGNKRLARKKGNYLLDERERMKILEGIKEVDEVAIYDSNESFHHADITDALKVIKPDVYCAGADPNKLAIEACNKLGIEVIENVGGYKTTSSSAILKNYIEAEQYKNIVDLMPIMCVDGIIVHNGKYLLVKRKNNPLKGEYFVPGGRVHKNERLEDALHRKMFEELGIKVKILGTAGFYEDFYKENDLGLDSVHTTSVVFIVSPLDLNIKLDEQSEDYIWSETLPDKLNLNVAKLV